MRSPNGLRATGLRYAGPAMSSRERRAIPGWWRGGWCAAVPLLAALAGPAAPATRAARLESLLAAGAVPAARAHADSLLRARERRAHRDPGAAAAFADSLGLAFFRAGTPEALAAAEPYFLAGLALRERAHGRVHPAVADAAATLATLNDYLGRWDRALDFERRALAIRLDRLGPDHRAVAASRRQVGVLLFYAGRYDQSAAELERAVEVIERAADPDSALLADALNARAEVHRVRDRFADAERDFRRGLAIADAAPAVPAATRAALVNNLAGLFKDLGRYHDAGPLLDRSLELRLAEQPPDLHGLATAELNRAEVLRLQGRLAEAAPGYRRALELSAAVEGPDHPDRIPVINQAATLELALGRLGRADSLFAAAEAAARRLSPLHPQLAQTLHDRAGVHEAAGRAAAAESLLAAALAIRARTLGDSHPEAAITRLAIARVRAGDPARGDAAAAAPLAAALAVLERSPGHPEARLEALALAARLTWRAGNRDSAIRAMSAALEAMEGLRARRGGGGATRQHFVAAHLSLVDDLLAWQIERGDAAGAFATRERARARTLLDQLAAAGVDLAAGIPPRLRRTLEDAIAAAEQGLAAAQRRVTEASFDAGAAPGDRLAARLALEAARDSAATALEQARARLEDHSPLWREVLSAGGVTATAVQARAALGPGETLIAFHAGARRSWVFVVPARGPVAAFELELAAADAALFGLAQGPLDARALEVMVAGDPDAAAPLQRRGLAAELATGPATGREAERRARRLHAAWRTLLPTAAWRAIRGRTRAVVVPDGALHLLPFEALVTAPRGPRYWLDQGPPLTYAASATSLLALERRAERPAAGRVVSVADPAFGEHAARPGGGRWPPLPATREESARLERAFAGDTVVALLGNAATEARVRAALPGARLVHLATHGFVTGARGDLLAGLALAAPAGAAPPHDDGRLQLYEIYQLPLACDLAVLSACGSHRGPRVAGEGVHALSRGFHAAGARRVIASLWPVEDRAAAALIAAAIEPVAADWRRGRPADVARHLRDARRSVRSDARWADPFYWAPFVASGAR